MKLGRMQPAEELDQRCRAKTIAGGGSGPAIVHHFKKRAVHSQWTQQINAAGAGYSRIASAYVNVHLVDIAGAGRMQTARLQMNRDSGYSPGDPFALYRSDLDDLCRVQLVEKRHRDVLRQALHLQIAVRPDAADD